MFRKEAPILHITNTLQIVELGLPILAHILVLADLRRVTHRWHHHMVSQNCFLLLPFPASVSANFYYYWRDVSAVFLSSGKFLCNGGTRATLH